MKTLILLFAVIVLSACGQSSGGGSGSSDGGGSTTAPDLSTPSDNNGGVDPTVPVVVVTPPVTTPPTPSAFTCYVNSLQVFCTGGNLGSTISQLDMNAVFTGNNPQISFLSATTTSGVPATHSAVCSQPNDPGCYAVSSCVTVSMHVQGVSSPFSETSCGNALSSSNIFEDL